MFGYPHKYEDWDGKEVTEKLWFNITKMELMANLDILDRFKSLEKIVEGERRTLEPHEVRMMLDLVKLVMRLAYGVRPDDVQFDKSEEVWNRFVKTKAYDSLLEDLFFKQDLANVWLVSILPPDLRAEAETELQKKNAQAVVEAAQTAVPEIPTAPPVLETTTEPTKAEPTDEELLQMDYRKLTPEQQARAYVAKMNQQNQ